MYKNGQKVMVGKMVYTVVGRFVEDGVVYYTLKAKTQDKTALRDVAESKIRPVK